MERPSMRKFVDCEEESGKLVLHEEERVLLSLKDIEVSFSNVIDDILGKYDLTITSSRLVLLNKDSSYEFDIPFIGLHAVSRDPNSYHKPCIYCQLDQEDGELPDELFLAPDNSISVMPSTVFTFPSTSQAPTTASTEDLLKSIFDGLCEAASLNPDPFEIGHDIPEGEDELIYNIDEVNLGAQQASMLSHLESCFQEPAWAVPADDQQKFDDAEKDGEGDEEELQPPKKK